MTGSTDGKLTPSRHRREHRRLGRGDPSGGEHDDRRVEDRRRQPGPTAMSRTRLGAVRAVDTTGRCRPSKRQRPRPRTGQAPRNQPPAAGDVAWRRGSRSGSPVRQRRVNGQIFRVESDGAANFIASNGPSTQLASPPSTTGFDFPHRLGMTKGGERRCSSRERQPGVADRRGHWTIGRRHPGTIYSGTFGAERTP